MLKRVIAVLFVLSGCDVAPQPTDFERNLIQTPEQGYRVFADGLLASNMARQVAKTCAGYRFDEVERERYFNGMIADWKRLAREDPATFDGLMRRIGLSITPAEMQSDRFDSLQSVFGGLNVGAYQARNAGITADLGGRAIGSILRRGLTSDCADAKREVAQKTLAGSFLKPVEG